PALAGRGRAGGAPGRAGAGPDRALGTLGALGPWGLGGQALDPGPGLGGGEGRVGGPGGAGAGPDRALGTLGALGPWALGGQALDPGPELGVAGLLLLPHGDQRRGGEARRGSGSGH